MLYVLEGCDATGKTTFAQELKTRLEAEGRNPVVMHFGADIAQNKSAYRIFESIIERSKNQDIIVDRFMHGQFVYQSTYERSITYNQLSILECKARDCGAIFYLFEADPDVIQERLAVRGEPMIDAKAIMEKYRKLFKDSLVTPILVTT